jgi:ubiquinone/menaquinone biosynthesis C-methylase UbiE
MWKERVNKTLNTLTGYQIQRAVPAQRSPGTRQKREPEQESPMTVAEGWDSYAQQRKEQKGVGDVWNRPRRIGIDVESPEEVVPYLDREVFTPFLGTVDVLLEIGPGAGRLTEVLLPKCNKLIAVDTSATMVDLLRQRFEKETKIEYHLSDGRGLRGIPAASVDAAFSYGVFVHLQHWDIYNYLTELKRVLKPGGKALIQHSNTFSDLGWKSFLREVPRQLNKHKSHQSFIVNTPELMSEFVRRAGLEVQDTLTEVVRRDCITLVRKPA